jgi:hypothetical protein
MKLILRTGRRSRRGSALLLSMVAIVAMTGIAGAILASSLSSKQELGGAVQHTRAMYVAEAGVSAALVQLTGDGIAELGTEQAPTTFGDGAYWGTVVNNGDNTFTVTSVGRSGGETRAVQATLRGPTGGAFNNAIFAGNSSNSGTYNMRFGGRGAQADRIVGDIYSGNAATFVQDSRIDGVPRAFTSVSTTPSSILPDANGQARSAQTGETQPIPDIAGMNYPVTADVKVNDEFRTAVNRNSPQGGRAWTLPASNPAHIFVRNPSDRVAQTALTPRDDYFLEDWTQPLRTDANSDGRNPNVIQLTRDGPTANPGPRDGNNKVYYIDGNLWIHNNSSMSFQLRHQGGQGTRITIVVKGNIYISDNIFYQNRNHDGLALIAIKDTSLANTGNIYFGDPAFGTLENMDSFMYAENNFYDSNLSASGSARLVLNGNMTAGNQVAINRDNGLNHTKLTVNFDDRLMDQSIDLPGIPGVNGAGPTGFMVLMMREVPVP